MAKDFKVDTLQEAILDLVRRIEKLLSRQSANPRQRILVALAGVPGSGKSTVSHAVLAELELRGVKDVAIVPMVCSGLGLYSIFLTTSGRLPLHQRSVIDV